METWGSGYRTTGVRILPGPGPGPGETKIAGAGAGAGAGGRKLSRIILIYDFKQLQKKDSCRGGDRRLPGYLFLLFLLNR